MRNKKIRVWNRYKCIRLQKVVLLVDLIFLNQIGNKLKNKE